MIPVSSMNMSATNKLILEGNIGCGKTTLAHTLALHIPRTHLLAENVNESLLKLFYTDKTRYAFTLQLYMLESRCNANRLQMHEHAPNTKLFIMDRSLLGDIVFALTNYVLGTMSDAEFHAYTELAHFTSLANIGALLSDVYGDCWRVVYLHSHFDECKARVDTVRQSCEKDVLGAWYYEVLEVIYCNVLLQLMPVHAAHIRVVHWAQYSEAPHTVLANVTAPRGDAHSSDTRTLLNWSNSDEPSPIRVLHARMERLSLHWIDAETREALFSSWSGVHPPKPV